MINRNLGNNQPNRAIINAGLNVVVPNRRGGVDVLHVDILDIDRHPVMMRRKGEERRAKTEGFGEGTKQVKLARRAES
jgi:hypothetical protein